jgi:phosphoribosylanthranilate isomerase
VTTIRPGSVKICSLREIEHARYVLDAGADLFGLIFAPARRQVTTERAREIVDAVRRDARGAPPLAVGVFVDASLAEIEAVVQAMEIDLVQLHGSEPPELVGMLPVSVVKAIRPLPGASVDDVHREIERYARAAGAPLAYLLDGFHASRAGGEGVRADWSLAAELAKSWPIMLAGGLDPASVAAAIRAVGPLGVDVSSGVETDGVKDQAKIGEFVRNARAAFSRGDRLIADG